MSRRKKVQVLKYAHIYIFFKNSKLDSPLNFGFGHKILYVDRQRISEYDPWKFSPNSSHIIGYINKLVLFSYDSPPSDARRAPNYIRTPIIFMTHMKIGTIRNSKMRNTPYALLLSNVQKISLMMESCGGKFRF